MANITVKKADNSTDITFTALAGSSGEGVPALWRHEDGSLPAALRPFMRTSAKNGTNGRRTQEALVVFPIVQEIGGVKTQVGTHSMRLIGTLTFTDAQANVDEAVAQSINLFDSTTMVAAFKEGYAPRG
jgi:hypothetical protein